MSYESPITMIYREIQTQIEDGMLKAVQDVGFNVNKIELQKALMYDRKQYSQGFEDGKKFAEEERGDRMKRILNPEEFEVCPFDGTTASRVYLGGLADLEKVILTWRTDEERSEMRRIKYYVLTLKEIADRLREKTDLITVIVQRPLSGEIYQWGNYGDEWWQIGTLDGYA